MDFSKSLEILRSISVSAPSSPSPAGTSAGSNQNISSNQPGTPKGNQSAANNSSNPPSSSPSSPLSFSDDSTPPSTPGSIMSIIAPSPPSISASSASSSQPGAIVYSKTTKIKACSVIATQLAVEENQTPPLLKHSIQCLIRATGDSDADVRMAADEALKKIISVKISNKKKNPKK